MNNRQRWLHVLAALMILVAAFPGAVTIAQDNSGSASGSADDEKPEPEVDRRWLDRLDQLDRYLLDELIGYAPPGFAEDLNWVGGDPFTWEKLRGRVVLLQSWTSKTSAGRGLLSRMEKLVGKIDSEDLQVILLHTPEGADTAARFTERRKPSLPVVIDEKGEFCDALGVYRRPVNIIVGRSGAVRYAGLNARGLDAAVKRLLEEKADSGAAPEARPEAEVIEEPQFPPVTGSVRDAADVRGQRAPDFNVKDWVTDQPNMRGKVVMAVFWESRKPESAAAAPRLNELAEAFKDDVVIVAISDEDKRKVRSFMRSNPVSFSTAIDFREKMRKAVNAKVMPHCIVISSDWVVRWQGNPSYLAVETLEQVVIASKFLDQPREVKIDRRRWTRGR